MLRGERLQRRRVVGIRQDEERIARLQFEPIARRELVWSTPHIDENAARRPERTGDCPAVEG